MGIIHAVMENGFWMEGETECWRRKRQMIEGKDNPSHEYRAAKVSRSQWESL